MGWRTIKNVVNGHISLNIGEGFYYIHHKDDKKTRFLCAEIAGKETAIKIYEEEIEKDIPNRYKKFISELTKISEKYGITIQSIGGVSIYDEKKLKKGSVQYSDDFTSGDIIPEIKKPKKEIKTRKRLDNSGSADALSSVYGTSNYAPEGPFYT